MTRMGVGVVWCGAPYTVTFEDGPFPVVRCVDVRDRSGCALSGFHARAVARWAADNLCCLKFRCRLRSSSRGR